MSYNKVYDINWQVGAHTSFSGSIYDTLKTSINYGMYSTQFFMGSPQSTNRAKISSEDIEKSKKILNRFPMSVFSHFPYISNLAGSVSSLAWNGDSEQDSKTEKVINSLEYELSVLANFNGGVVIHPGNFKDRKKGIETISESINKIKFIKDSKLILENAAGQGCSLATTFQEIMDIIDGVEKSKKKHIGVCIDTCHLFAYGEYNLSEIKEIERMFSDFDEIIGLDRFTLLHLNDSETDIKSRVDRHACLGKGYIWGKSFESLIYLLNKCKEYKIPAVLETCTEDMLTLAELKKK